MIAGAEQDKCMTASLGSCVVFSEGLGPALLSEACVRRPTPAHSQPTQGKPAGPGPLSGRGNICKVGLQAVSQQGTSSFQTFGNRQKSLGPYYMPQLSNPLADS